MDWQATGAIAELAGALGVIASLLYLAIQIRQSSRASKAEAVQAVQQSMIDISLAIASDPSWAKIFERAEDSYLNLSREDKTRLGWLWFAVMRGTETLYHHYLRGNADWSMWESHEGAVVNNLHNPGFREWWRNVGYPFTREFTEFVDSKLRLVEESGEAYKWFGNAK